MNKRKAASVRYHGPSPETKKPKLTGLSSRVEIDPNVETQAKRVFSIPELGARILRFLPRDQIRCLRTVCKQFLALNKNSGVQEYTHDVPPQGKVGEEVLQFCGKKIADFVAQVGTHHQERSKILTRLSCVQGYDGEGFLETGDAVYDLTPEHLKRIVCTLLAIAWSHNDQKTKNTVTVPMQPGKFDITCDASVIQDVSWTAYCMTGEFSRPRPETTFEATVNWVFELLALYSASRLENLPCCPLARASRFKEAMILQRGHSIERTFRVARDTSWSLEQICYIVDRIPEEHHPLYIPGEDLEDF
jgi:hypothetical protein